MEILVTAFYIVVCVLLFAMAILIHEFGHFVMALKLGLRVEAFSIGFGKPIWKKRIKGVEYRISPILLGGYVSIPDVDPEGTKALEGSKARGAEHKARIRIPAWKEILVAVAGPLMNVVLAAVIAVVLALAPGVRFGIQELNVKSVMPGKCGASAGILPGDRIVEINGNAVASKNDMQVEFVLARGRPSALTVLRGGTNVVLTVEPEFVKVTPVTELPLLWVGLEEGAGGDVVPWMPDRNPLKQLAWDAGQIFRVLKGLATPNEMKETGKAIGGPVLIAQALYRQVRSEAWNGLGFLRFINVNLAIINLLPLPVLDGGLILFALFALVFRRRVPEVVVKYLSLAFMALLIALMAFLVLRDSWRSYKLYSYKPGDGTAATNVMQAASGTNGTDNATSQDR